MPLIQRAVKVTGISSTSTPKYTKKTVLSKTLMTNPTT